MQNFFQKFNIFVNQPLNAKTAGIIIVIILLFAIPLTLFINQQPQQIRQRAEESQISAVCEQCVVDARKNGSYTPSQCDLACGGVGKAPHLPNNHKYLCEPVSIAPYYSEEPCAIKPPPSSPAIYQTQVPAPTSSPSPIATATTIPTAKPNPTATSTPILSPSPSSSIFNPKIIAGMDGIGNKTLANSSPKTIKRTVKIEAKALNKTPLILPDVELTYNPTTGNFEGQTEVGTLPNNTYEFDIKAGKYLKGSVKNIVIESPIANQQKTITLNVTLATRDALIYNILPGCFGKLAFTTCIESDLNDDGQINGLDYNIFIRGLTFKD